MSAQEEVQEEDVEAVPEPPSKVPAPGITVVASWTCAILFGLTTGTIIVTSLAFFKEADDSEVRSSEERPRRTYPSCLTESCAAAAEALTMTLSFSVDPCHDLFAFVCRRYHANFFRILRALENDITTHATAVLFKTPVPAMQQASAIQKAAILFRSCMRMFVNLGQNTETSSVFESLMQEFSLSLQYSKSSTQSEPIETIMGLGVKYNIEAFLSLAVGNNLLWRKSSTVKISFSKDDIVWYDTIEKDKDAQKIYAKYYDAYYGSATSQTNQEFLRNVENLEEKIMKIVQKIPLKADDNVVYELMSLKSLEQKFKEPVLQNGQGFFKDDSSVHVDPKAMRFTEELSKFSKQDANFAVAYTLLRKYVMYASSPVLSKVSPAPLPRHLCIARVSEVMPGAIGAAYLFKLISNSTIQEAANIALRTRDAFIAAISKTKFLDQPSITAAITELRTMEFYVAFPKILADVNKLNAFYEPLDVKEQDLFFDSWIKASVALQRKKMSDVSGAVYTVDKPDVFYVVQSNRLVVLAPALRPTLFLVEGPESVNLGRLGAVIGREIMYGYNVNGSEYDSMGQIHYWWSPSAKEHYLKMAECVQQSAKNLTKGDTSLSSKTVALLLAEVVGLQMALHEFGRSGGEHSGVLPSLPFTPAQLFFLAHCYKSCGLGNTQNAATNEDRCNIPAMNTEQYADAFNCSHGDRMNPAKKCIFF
ncbi:neprilysin-11-like [Ornithodoros turicata]|uniref:neprilysin-11-like n=1 Tax=Ornithodoros turicata TaxID=34597 RepID=UPI0031397F4A